MIYFTFVGNHDKLDNPQNGLGALLTIFLQYKEQIEDVYIFVTPSKSSDKINYHQVAEQNKARMLAEKAGLNVELIPIDLSNPIDFDLVYPKLLREIQQLLSRDENREKEKIVNITSGTPTMTTCWVLLHKSGLISNSRLIQSFETRFARERGKSTQEVDLEIDNFPQITAPEELRLQLDIARKETKELLGRLTAAELDEKVPELIGPSPQIREIKDIILSDVDEEMHVLIVGEPGTGKQQVADAIWRIYHRQGDQRLTSRNCGSYSESLIISELFGHTQGAFTGATKEQPGVIRSCDGKMMFLDEIGNLPFGGQNALLRLLQFGEVQPVGSSKVYKVDVQVLAATNKDVDNPDIFAQDLKDRFKLRIDLPPLRERRQDIPVLANHFLGVFTKRRNLTSPLVFHPEVLQKLEGHSWQNNVRGLRNWVELVTKRFDGGEITLDRLPRRFITDIMRDEGELELPDLPLPVSLPEYTDKIREKAERIAGGNMAEVDRLLRQKPGAGKARRFRERHK